MPGLQEVLGKQCPKCHTHVRIGGYVTKLSGHYPQPMADGYHRVFATAEPSAAPTPQYFDLHEAVLSGVVAQARGDTTAVVAMPPSTALA